MNQYYCKFCNRTFSKTSSLKNHEITCLYNPVFNFSKDAIPVKSLSDIGYLENCNLKVQRNQQIRYNCEKCCTEVVRTYQSLKHYNFRLLCQHCLQADTNMQRYGKSNVAKVEQFKVKKIQTCLAKYGTENPVQSLEIKNKIWQNRSRKEHSEKMKTVWNNKTDSQRLQQRLKCRESKTFRSDAQRNQEQERAKATCRLRYGSDYWQTSEAFKQGLLERLKNSRKRYTFEAVHFDSSWELALWIFAKDHKETIEREPVTIDYEWQGKVHKYIPDFRYKGELLELKGNHLVSDERTQLKLKVAAENSVKILYLKDIQIYLDYCRKKFKNKLWYRAYRNY